MNTSIKLRGGSSAGEQANDDRTVHTCMYFFAAQCHWTISQPISPPHKNLLVLSKTMVDIQSKRNNDLLYVDKICINVFCIYDSTITNSTATFCSIKHALLVNVTESHTQQRLLQAEKNFTTQTELIVNCIISSPK